MDQSYTFPLRLDHVSPMLPVNFLGSFHANPLGLAECIAPTRCEGPQRYGSFGSDIEKMERYSILKNAMQKSDSTGLLECLLLAIFPRFLSVTPAEGAKSRI